MTPDDVEELYLHGIAGQAGRLLSIVPCATVFEIDCDRAAAALPVLEKTLDAAERASLDRIRHPLQRQRATVVRAALRWVLGAYLQVSPERVPLVRQPDGRPRLRTSPAERQLHVSSSSCGALGTFAVASGTEVGVDLECATQHRFPSALTQHILHPREVEIFEALPPDARTAWLVSAWVCKEALLKALGLGLTLDPRNVEVMSSVHLASSEGGIFRPQGLAPWFGRLRRRGIMFAAVACANPRTQVGTVRLRF